MSTATSASPVKRSVPVPPAKPKMSGTPPKAGMGANTGQATPSPGNPAPTVLENAGSGVSQGSPSSASLVHRRVASASPSVGSTSPSQLPSHGSTVTAAAAPPKLAPKPPGRPKSGAFAPAIVPSPAPPPSSSTQIPSHLLLAPSELHSLAFTYAVSKSEVDALQMLFLEMDTDNDGVISLADLLRYKYASRKAQTAIAAEPALQETKDEIGAGGTLSISFQSTNSNGMVPSSSAPRLLKLTSEEDDSDSDDSMSEAKRMLQDMDLTESSEEPSPAAASATPTLAEANAASPKQGLSFRHIDFSTLPQDDNDSGDDDHLLADWDGPPGTEDDAKSTGSKPSKHQKSLSSSGSFGGLKKKLSKGALNLKSKLNAAGK